MFGISVVDAHESSNTHSKKFLLLITFLCGSSVFYGYQAKLTSALAVPIVKLPFTSPEKLLESNYK